MWDGHTRFICPSLLNARQQILHPACRIHEKVAIVSIWSDTCVHLRSIPIQLANQRHLVIFFVDRLLINAESVYPEVVITLSEMNACCCKTYSQFFLTMVGFELILMLTRLSGSTQAYEIAMYAGD
jgi:hypothetical protein